MAAHDPPFGIDRDRHLSLHGRTRHVRGLIVTTQITVRTTEHISDMQLTFDRGWFESMTFNKIVPQLSNQFAGSGKVVFDFGSVPSGTEFAIRISSATNPANAGRHPQTVTPSDRHKKLMSVQRTLTVFP